MIIILARIHKSKMPNNDVVVKNMKLEFLCVYSIGFERKEGRGIFDPRCEQICLIDDFGAT